jgi:hypothetical protein
VRRIHLLERSVRRWVAAGDLLAAPPAPEVAALDVGEMTDDAQQAQARWRHRPLRQLLTR